MNLNKIMLKIFFLFVLILNLDVSAQEVELDLIGNWNLTDFWSNESKTIFTKDGYISMTINGEKIDGKNFIIRGGPNDGEKGEMKYVINTKISPIQIDIIALKDNIEKGRILGIITPVNHTKILMVLSFDGKRPEAINDENFEQTLTLYKTE